MVCASQWFQTFHRYLIPTVLVLTIGKCSNTGVQNDFTTLIINPNPDQATHIIKPDENNFMKLTQESRCLADNTLLIEELLQIKAKTIQIVAPPKWGKTTNLNMLKIFLQIAVDESGTRVPLNETPTYKLFKYGILPDGNRLRKPPLISKRTTLLGRWMGQYPVITVSLEGSTPESFESIECVNAFIRTRIRNTFAEHGYLKKGLQNLIGDSAAELDLQFYTKIEENTASDKDFRICLLRLSEILYRFFNKHVFLLVDDYDTVIRNIFLSNVTGKTMAARFCHDMLVIGLNANSFSYQAVLTAVLRISTQNAMPWGFKNVEPYEFLDNDIFKHFAINERHFEDMCQYLSIDAETKTSIRHWYAGYRAGVNSSLNIYHPWSLAMYFKHRSFQSYRQQKPSLIEQMIPTLVQDLHVQKALCTLLCGYVFDVVVEKHDPFRITTADFRIISSRFHEKTREDYMCGNLILKFLLATGYVTLSEDFNPYDHVPHDYAPTKNLISFYIRLPNRNVELQIRDYLADLYAETFAITDKTILQNASIELAKEFNSFLLSDEAKARNETKSLQIEKSWNQFLHQMPPFDDGVEPEQNRTGTITLNETLIYSAVNALLAFSSGTFKFITHKLTFAGNVMPPMLLMHENHVILLEIRITFPRRKPKKPLITKAPHWTEFTFRYTVNPNRTFAPYTASQEMPAQDTLSQNPPLLDLKDTSVQDTAFGEVASQESKVSKTKSPKIKPPPSVKSPTKPTKFQHTKPSNTISKDAIKASTKLQSTKLSSGPQSQSPTSPSTKSPKTTKLWYTQSPTKFRPTIPKIANTKSPFRLSTTKKPKNNTDLLDLDTLDAKRKIVDNFFYHELKLPPARRIRFVEIHIFLNKTVVISAVTEEYTEDDVITTEDPLTLEELLKISRDWG